MLRWLYLAQSVLKEKKISSIKEDGCISVEMECSALQAMCDFRGLNFYATAPFLFG